MADETVSTAVKMLGVCATRNLELSETVAAGEVVKLTSSQIAKAQAVVATATTEINGLCVLGGDAAEYGIFVTSGEVDPGFAVTPGAVYYVSVNSGKITKTLTDLTGAGVAILGYGITASKLKIDPDSLGVVA